MAGIMKDLLLGFKKVHVVLFDFDGTLIDSEEAIVESFIKAANKLNVRLDDYRVKALLGTSSEYIIRKASLQRLNEDEVKRIANLRRRIFENIWRKKVRLFPEVPEVLKALRQAGLKIGIASSNREDRLIRMVKFYGLDRLIDIMVGYGGDVRPKPYPDILLRALNLLGARSEEAIYVGDSFYDYLASRKAGIDFVLLDREGRYRNRLNVIIINNLRELINLLHL